MTFHEKTLRQIIGDLGYEAHCINEGLAVVYGELEDSNYTGIGVSCGGGLCNVCLSYLSVPVLSFSVPKAGDFIDLNASQISGERANRIRLAKEATFHFNGYFPERLLRRRDPDAGAQSARGVRTRRQLAAIHAPDPDGPEWWHRDASGLPRSL
jgi:hypothetical protein